MPLESTVLLVSAQEPPASLLDSLEERGVFVETTTTSELESTYPVVSPDLVVHFGSEGAESSIELLSGTPERRRVRLIVVVARATLPQIRQMNRSVVASALADDMPESALVERIISLAQKSAAQIGKVPLASLTPSPLPLPPTALSRAAIPRPLLSTSTPHVTSPSLTPRPLTSRAPAPLPPLASKARTALQGDRGSPPPPPLAPRVSDSPRVNELTPLEPPRELPPIPEKFPAALAPTAIANERLALVDDDITRADALGRALRELGYLVQLVPTDPAKTRWTLLRRFSPQVIVTNTTSEPSSVWRQLVTADSQLKSALWITAPYHKIFDDQTGSLQLESLLARLGPLQKSDVPRAPVPALDIDDEDARPTLIADELTSAPPPAGTATGEARTEPPVTHSDVAAPLPVDTGDLPAPPLSHRDPTIQAPLTGERSAPDLTQSARGLSVSQPPERGRGKSKVTRFALAAALFGVGTWFVLHPPAWSPLGSRSPETARAPEAETAQATELVPEPETTEAPKSEEHAEEVIVQTEPLDLWTTAESPETVSCERLIENPSELRQGDTAQSTFYWDKARSALVLGDSRTATAHLCRAVAIHPQSLAVEALAESYLTQGSPEQAKHWIDEALKHRPGRPKTLDLLGDIECQRGQIEEARRAWTTALQVSETDQKTLDAVAKQLSIHAQQALRSSTPARAEILYRRAALLSPTNLEAAAGLVRVHLATARNERAELWLREAEKRGSEAPENSPARNELQKLREETAAAGTRAPETARNAPLPSD